MKRIGNKQVHVKVAPNGIFEGCESIDLWNGKKEIPDFVLHELESPDKVVVRPATRNLPFTAFLSLLANQENLTASYYLEYLSIKSYLPELKNQNLSFFSFASFLELKHQNLWFGDGKTVSMNIQTSITTILRCFKVDFA